MSRARRRMSALRRRMQPWETRAGTRSGRSVPWSPTKPPAGQSVSVGEVALVPKAIGPVGRARVAGEAVAGVERPGRRRRARAPDPDPGVELRAAGAQQRRGEAASVDDQARVDDAVAAERGARDPAGGVRCAHTDPERAVADGAAERDDDVR